MEQLTQAELKKHFWYTETTGVFIRKYKTHGRAGFCPKGSPVGWLRGGYIIMKINGREYKAHQLAWLYVYGEFPNCPLDHKNTISCDNRIKNLRILTPAQNSQNMSKPHKDSKSGFLGVSYIKLKKIFRAEIMTNGKRLYIGESKTAEAAGAAYLETKKKLHTLAFVAQSD